MFRVTMSQTLASTQAELTRRSATAAKLQADLATGVRIRRPSDDPRGQQIVLNQRAQLQQVESRLRSIAETRSRLDHAHRQILDVQQLFVQAKTLALQGRQATDQSERDILAAQVDRLLETLVQLANATHEGEPLFAGADLNATPFSTDSPTGEATYTGSTLPGQRWLADGTVVDVLYSGADVFQPGGRGDTLVIGQTGAAAGLGTSSARGTRSLLVQHTATLVSPGSGVQAGASSPGGDTILGPAGTHQLTLVDESGTGAYGTVSLNGGPPVAFTSADTDLRVTGPGGEVVYLDLSNITPGFNGTVDLTGEGTLSVDGGVTSVPIDYSSAQGVLDSRDGTITYIDSRGIVRPGTDLVEFTETLDAFQTLARLRDELRNVDRLPAQELAAALGRRLDDLDRISTHLLAVVGDQSATLQQLDRMQSLSEDLQLQVQQLLADTEGTDYAAATIALQEQQTWMQFSLATIVRLFDISVLNYL